LKFRSMRQGEATRIYLDNGKVLGGRAAVLEQLPASDQCTWQGDAFSQVVRGVLPLPYGLDDAVCNMRVIDALFRSEASQAWSRCKPACTASLRRGARCRPDQSGPPLLLPADPLRETPNSPAPKLMKN